MFTHHIMKIYFHNIKNLVQHIMDFSHHIMHTIQHIIKCEQDIMTMMHQMFSFLTIRQLWRSTLKRVNMLMQYTYFSAVHLKFHSKTFDIFNILVQNIDCGFTEAVLTSTHRLYFAVFDHK